MPQRLPDNIFWAHQKIQNKKVAQTRQKIINYIEKYHKSQSRCAACNRKGSISEITRESVKIRCAKCKRVWIFKKKFSRTFLPNRLFVKPKRKKDKNKEIKKQTTLKVKLLSELISPKPISKKLEKKILEILKGNITVKLSNQ